MKVKAGDILKQIFIIGLFQGVIATYLGFRQCIYICDLLLVLACLFLFKNHRKVPRVIKYPIIVFSVIVLIGMVYNFAFDLQALWGLRNNYRFFVFMLLIVIFMNEEDTNWCVRVYESVFWTHIALLCFQYFIGGYKRDYLGGIWGVAQGCNGGLLLYYIGMVVIGIYRYNRKQIGLMSLLLSSLAMCITAAWAELKFFYIVLVVLWLCYILLSRYPQRTIGIILAVIVCIPVASIALEKAFSEYSNFFEITSLINRITNSTNYATLQDIGRSAVFTRVPELMNAWLGHESANLFGIGIGHADYSTSIESFNSAFYQAYEYTHYSWLHTAFLLVETGYLGLIAYIAFYISILLYSVHQYRVKGNEVFLYEILLCIACIILIFYNASLRTNYAYIAFFLLAIPFVSHNDELFAERPSIMNRIRRQGGK